MKPTIPKEASKEAPKEAPKETPKEAAPAAPGNNVYGEFVEKFVKPVVDASNALGGKYVSLV